MSNVIAEMKKGKTLVVVTTPSCGPCKIIKREVLPNITTANVVVVDATQDQQSLDIIQMQTGAITSVPVFVLYNDGIFQKRRSGSMDLDTLLDFIDE